MENYKKTVFKAILGSIIIITGFGAVVNGLFYIMGWYSLLVYGAIGAWMGSTRVLTAVREVQLQVAAKSLYAPTKDDMYKKGGGKDDKKVVH